MVKIVCIVLEIWWYNSSVNNNVKLLWLVLDYEGLTTGPCCEVESCMQLKLFTLFANSYTILTLTDL